MSSGMDSEATSADGVEAAAAQWFWRRDRVDWAAADQARFDEWLAASTAHRVAWLRLKVGWEKAARMRALGAGVPAGMIPEPGAWGDKRFLRAGSSSGAQPASAVQSLQRETSPRRSRIARFAVAASLGVLLLTGVYLAHLALLSGVRYSTPVGGLDTVPLADGSQVTLNTDTRIRVEISERERRIELDKGEAFFDVAKDPARPFVVHVNEKRIVAVGTKFAVRRDGNDIRVAVTEGKVLIDRAEGGVSSSARPAGATADVLLAAGSIAQTSRTEVLVRRDSKPEAEQLLSWRSGYLMFEATPLATAVAEFNRYNTRKIVIGDSSIAQLPIGGNFRCGNIDGFLWLLEAGFPIDVRRDGDEITLAAR